jgi:hypothetical protein
MRHFATVQLQAVAMIKNGAPRVIHSDKQLAEYTEALRYVA